MEMEGIKFAQYVQRSLVSIMFPLSNDNAIEIHLKKPVSKNDFVRILKLIQLSEDSIVIQEDEQLDIAEQNHTIAPDEA